MFIDTVVERTRLFAAEVEALRFTFDGYIYNPLKYAWDMHEAYLRAYVQQGSPVFFLGMNPGPFGMVQTGVPFGEIEAVRDWMHLSKKVGRPPQEHPKRPVLGLEIGRSEVSGKRLWALMAERFGSATNFFSKHTVMNYCPLAFVSGGETGRNIIPEKLIKAERLALEDVCDTYLDDIITLVAPQHLVGIGQYAKRKLTASEKRLQRGRSVSAILHPSPANPQANAGWAERVVAQLEEAQIW